MAKTQGTLAGRKLRGFFDVPGTEVSIPYTDVRGAADGPTLLLSGGVHGGEYPGIAAAIEIARRLEPGEIKGRVIVLHLTNPPAFWGRSQYYNPLDGKNLNRCFPGDAAGSASERMAARVIAVLREADYWIDMHGGDIHEALVPFTIFSDYGKEEVRRTAQAMAEAYGIPRLIRSASVAGGSYAAAAELGVPAILPEAGQLGQLDPCNQGIHEQGVLNVLRLLGMLSGSTTLHLSPQIYTRFVWSRAPQAGFWRSRVHPGERVEAGAIGGVLHDVYGDLLHEIAVPETGEVLFAASSFAIGADDPLFAVAAP
ncbi:MAG: M14 family metallopeptidase [Thermaerobacter sp.]|nr:M14 family metallopeptidase [Thermaerobacter sp.]